MDVFQRDLIVLFLTRTVRMFSYGAVGIILALYLSAVGLSDKQLGLLLTLTLLGDSVISLAVTRWADRIGRRFMLVSSCLLMVLSGLVYGEVRHPSFTLLLAAATVGVLSPSGNEVGPFMALEQSILAERVATCHRTYTFAWYNLVGYSMTALGALGAGQALTWAQRVYDVSDVYGYRTVFLSYAVCGALLLVLFLALSEKVERPNHPRRIPSYIITPPGAGGGTESDGGLRAPLLPTVGASASDPEGQPEVEATAFAVDRVLVLHTSTMQSQQQGQQPSPPHPPQHHQRQPQQSQPPPNQQTQQQLHEQLQSPSGLTKLAPPPKTKTKTPVLPSSSPAGSNRMVEDAVSIADCDRGNEAGDRAAVDSTAATMAATESKSDCEIVACDNMYGNTSGNRCSNTGGGGGVVTQGALGMSPRSHNIVLRLSVLFATDAFAGSLVTGTLLAYYFQIKYGVSTAYLGGLLFGANLLAAASSLASGWVADRIGLLPTMVFTHLPSNVMMMAVPLMPSLRTATLMLFARYCISQMDVAPRSSYVAGVVRPEERTAAMGVTNIAKSIGAAFGPLLTGYLAHKGLFSWAFYLCGGLKIVYDLVLLWSFSHVKPEH